MPGPLPIPTECLSEEQKNLELFNRGFGLDLTRLPDAEERFFLSEFVRGHTTFLLNQTNMPADEARTLLMAEPSEDRAEAMKSIHRLADLRKKAEEMQVAFDRVQDLLKSLGFEVDVWALKVDPFPTIESVSKKMAAQRGAT